MTHKILYIGFKYEYGNKNDGTGLNYEAWFKGFQGLGYETQGVFFDEPATDSLHDQIVSKAEQIRPDMIFFILQKSQVDVETLQVLKEKGFRTVGFFGDDQWRFDDWTYQYAPHFSACITTDRFSVDKYKQVGQANIIYSQWASLESSVKYEDVAYKYDVSFVGGMSPYRKWFVTCLQKRGIQVECFGGGWDNGRVSYEQMEDIFATSKINLNISNSTHFDVRFLLSTLKGMALALRSLLKGTGKNSSQMKARNFEIPVQGGFQLTDYVLTIEEYFNIGKEIICYNDLDEAEKAIQYYLRNEELREQVKQSGIKRARAEHTFPCRIIHFMKELDKVL